MRRLQMSCRYSSIGLIFFLWIYTLLAEGASGPRIFVPEKERNYDFGLVHRGMELSHVFDIQNIGDENLVIEKVRSSCGCTAALISTNIIKPGHVAKIRVTYFTGRASGSVNHRISIFSNDPISPLLNLSISAYVVYELDYAPERIEVRSPQIRNSQFIIRIRCPEDSQLRVVKLRSTSPKHITLTLGKPYINYAKELAYPIKVWFGNNYPIGKVDEKIIIETNSKIDKVITIPVKGEVTPNYIVRPRSIFFGILEPQDIVSKHVRLEILEDVTFKIKSVSQLHDSCKCDWRALQEGKVFEFTLTLNAAKYKGKVLDALIIHTNQKSYPVISIPFSAFIVAEQR